MVNSTDDDRSGIIIKELRKRSGFFIVAVLVVTIVLDSILLRTYDLYSKVTTSAWANLTFTLTVSISILAQFLLLDMLRRNKEKMKTKTATRFMQLNIAITVVQSLLAINLIVSVISIVTYSSYSTMILILGVTISYATTITLLLLLSIRFVSWFGSRRNIELLLYAIAASSIVVSAIITLLFSDLTLSHLPPNVRFRISGSSV